MRYLKLLTLITGLLFWPAQQLLAQPFNSNNYSIEESFIGPGGILDAESTNYSLRASLGDTGIDNRSSTNFQTYGGFTTTSEEYLEFVVNGATLDVGVLSGTSASTTSGTFYVRSYISNGYVVATVSDPPTNGGGASLDPLTTGGTSSPGTEQFGINLVENTIANGAPANYGADPQQIPDSSFSFGYAATNYDTDGTYRYNNGDIIAQADSSSGRTDFTISYLFNIDDFTTPAGVYTMLHTLVATPTF